MSNTTFHIRLEAITGYFNEDEDYLKYDRELLALLNDVTVAIARDSNKQLTELSTRIENILASL